MTRSHPDRVRVLLLQPDQDDREMYTEFLRHEGFAPIAVSTARAGLRLARHVAIVVSGLVLPGQMDGLEFVARLKADVRTRRIPAIVLTACAFATDRERAAAAGCDLYLAKPCLPEVLVREIRRLLRQRLNPMKGSSGATFLERRTCCAAPTFAVASS